MAVCVAAAVVAQLVLAPEPRDVRLPPRPAAAKVPLGPVVAAKPRREPIADGPFYVSTLDAAAQSYGVARYVDGRPSPVGELARVHVDASKRCPGLTSPAVTRGRDGEYLLYVTERVCDAPDRPRLGLWTSRDGRHFRRRATVQASPPMPRAYIVRDGDVFRAWYREDGMIHYAESSDGVRFTVLGGPKAAGATPGYVFKDGRRWYLLSNRTSDGRSDAALFAFDDPRQPRYEDLGAIAPRRSAPKRVVTPARRGARTVELSGTRGIAKGDLLVIRGRLGADAIQVARIRGDKVRLASPLTVRHDPGDGLDLATAGSTLPSYVCRERDGTWAGIFGTADAVPGVLFEPALVYRAKSIRGPWRVDRSATAPILALENRQRRRSTQSPTAVSRGVGVRRCGA